MPGIYFQILLSDPLVQDDVLMATGDLVVSLAGRKEIGRMLVASPGWLDLANTLYKQLERPRTVTFLLPAVLEKMVRNLQPEPENKPPRSCTTA